MISLERRDRQPEVMDQPGLDERLHHQALVGLERGNLISNTTGALWRGLADSGTLDLSANPIRILDVACGGGDNVIRLARLARKRGVALEADGCDVNPVAVAHAKEAAARTGISNAHFFRLDALADRLPNDYDAVICTLFLHHLEESDALEVLRRMAAATRHAVIVDDLARSKLGYALVLAGSYLITASPVVHVDGPLSVRAAFTIDEARNLADRAGLHGATFRRHWPERFSLVWRKP